MTKFSEHLRGFLPPSDLTGRLFSHWPAETQVNIREDIGEPIEGTTGREIEGFECFPRRFPKDAGTEPDWSRDYISWPLSVGAEAIGATGFTKQGSAWVGFDFDSITGHATGVGVTDEELHRVKEAAKGLAYVEARRSTGGAGLHLYVHLDRIPTANHTEHAAVARAVLGKMSRDAGFDFKASVDCFGGILWLWSRRATSENQGLALLKPATAVLTEADIAEWRTPPAVDAVRPAVEEDDDHWRIIAAYRQHGEASYDNELGCYRGHAPIWRRVHS